MLYDVVIPAGCVAGDTFQVQLGATVFEVTAPEGCGEGSSISIEAEADGEQQGGPRTVEVEIPAGCYPGDEFLVETAEATMTVVVPDGCSPGTMLEIELPSTPQPPVMEAPSTADAMQELALEGARSKSTPYGLYAPGGLYALPDSEPALRDDASSPPPGLYALGGLYALPPSAPAPPASPLHAKSEDDAAPMWSPSSVQSRLDLVPTPLHGSGETGLTGGGCYWADGTVWEDPKTAEKAASAAMVTAPGEFDFDDSYLIQRSDGSYSLGYIQEFDAGSELYRALIPGVGFKYVAREQIELDTVHF